MVLVIVASAGAAGARVVAADDLSRVSKAGDELAKAGGAKFRGTTSSGGGGRGAPGPRQGAHPRSGRRPVPEPRCGGARRSAAEPRPRGQKVAESRPQG